MKLVSGALRLARSFTRYTPARRKRAKRVPIANILRGGENGIPGNKYVRLVGDPLRSSTRISEGPHVQLLRAYLAEGAAIFDPQYFEHTAYYRNAAECIEFTGRYFTATRNREIIGIATNFLESFRAGATGSFPVAHGHSATDANIVLRPIAYSDCYELVDGNHRIANQIVEGNTHVIADIEADPAATPAQELLLDVIWQNGRQELYQPVELPEVAGWPLVRVCSDRLMLMTSFLRSRGLLAAGTSLLDLGCSYGWFLSQMKSKRGFEVKGVDRDPFALAVGRQIYNLPESNLIRSSIPAYLLSHHEKYDVVCLFSVLHHFLLSQQAITAPELIGLADKITSRVLFFETGQGTEAWFAKTLPGWTPEYIERWLKSNTTFSEIVPLGQDEDSRGAFAENYKRTLFACVR
ncbi:MAG: class I SAM-dependent methyltransferase [Rhodocyclaceae bacterium]|nr:class I SAM-dependent methyltransferase [Rhodocyclaceae bacterium]